MLLSAGGSNKIDRQVASSVFTSDVEVILMWPHKREFSPA